MQMPDEGYQITLADLDTSFGKMSFMCFNA